MTDTNTLPAANVPTFTMNNNLSVSDILSVAVSRAEGALQGKLDDAKARQKALDEALAATAKEIDAEIESIVAGTGLREKVKAMNDLASELLRRTDMFEVVTKPNAKDKSLIISISDPKTRGYGSSDDRSDRKLPFSAELVSLHEKAEQLGADREKVLAEIVDLRRRLSDIPAIERRYRGTMVESQLRQSSEGAKLLDDMLSKIGDL